MDVDKRTTTICTVVAIDHTALYYTVCSFCERTLPETNTAPPSVTYCDHCNFTRNTSTVPHRGGGGSTSKRLFRVLMSVATETKVFEVVMFDRAARVLFGCSAQDFVDFAKLHPFSGETASKILEGEMLKVTLSKPKNGNAQHQRVVSVVPLKSGFHPAMDTLRELHGVRPDC
ncbi:uncharacterized protein LOC111901436 isoform X1 [Lactuca sativa]|uniref:Replication factor A C-terminal domain-containing protein n=1 Tax=Lactuca sativa TaxID=4236 RepID=A0A9R1WH46_LACSA|nr:uncharacterized protein LOC111901436 isoform X1 [Lactuca sativa]KAJ0222341.1 hypothetical protein LSAT_V11C200085700 [Lactuca sativa]